MKVRRDKENSPKERNFRNEKSQEWTQDVPDNLNNLHDHTRKLLQHPNPVVIALVLLKVIKSTHLSPFVIVVWGFA